MWGRREGRGERGEGGSGRGGVRGLRVWARYLQVGSVSAGVIIMVHVVRECFVGVTI